MKVLKKIDKWTGLKICQNSKKKKIIVRISEKSAKSKQSNDKVKYESFEEKKKSVSGLGFFSVNGLGLKFVRFLKKENIVRISEKSAGKSSEKK
jgi:hypothetical protein